MTETEEILVYDAMIEIHQASTILAALVNLDATAAARKAYKSGVYGPCVKLQCVLGQEALDRGKARHEKIKREADAYFANADFRHPEYWNQPESGFSTPKMTRLLALRLAKHLKNEPR